MTAPEPDEATLAAVIAEMNRRFAPSCSFAGWFVREYLDADLETCRFEPFAGPFEDRHQAVAEAARVHARIVIAAARGEAA